MKIIIAAVIMGLTLGLAAFGICIAIVDLLTLMTVLR